MPELPEVQTTVTGLQKTIVGKTIQDVWSNSFSLATINKNNHKNKEYFSTLQKAVKGVTVLSVSRRGKNILLHLSTKDTLVIHMRMTGHLLHGVYTLVDTNSDTWPWKPKEKGTSLSDSYNRHIRTVFTLKKNNKETHLVFCDSRKFGSIELFSANSLHKKIQSLGKEPLDTDFSPLSFKELLTNKRRGFIKSVLMDQSTIAGIGNIYSDEALHLSHIHPQRQVTTLSDAELLVVFHAIQKVLSSGIDFGGDSMSDYRNVNGERGAFQTKHLVYLRTGKECLRMDCLGKIQKKKVGGRSAHFCTHCQK